MRYVIGAKIVENNGDVVDGVLAYDKYGLATVIGKRNDDEHYKEDEYKTMVFTQLQDANEEVTRLSKAYKAEFRRRAKKYNLDISKFRFFVLKVDTPKFKYKIGEEYFNRNIKYKMYYIF